MADVIISPNMGLPVPVVDLDPGPDWATNINACLAVIDSHNHTTGQGVPITPAAININSDLTMVNNNLTNARSIRFFPQGVALNQPSDLGALYELGVDLFYIDGAGNNVRLTQGGAPAGATGTITGLPSGTASASFAANTFTFQSATNTPAFLAVGPVIIAQPVVNGKSVTISPAVAQAANYNLTLPAALPLSQSALSTDTSGNQSFIALDFGTYTPTGGAGSNIPSVTPQLSQWSRIGNIVTVSGITSITTTASGGTSSFSLSLPVATTMAADSNCAGCGNPQTGTGADNPWQVQSTSSNRTVAQFLGNSGASGVSTVTFIFSYQVL